MPLLKARKSLAVILSPLSIIYGIIVSIRNKCFDLNILKSTEFDFPVISVGNLTTGGTGKTPHIEYLVKLLHDDHKIAVLSRGYKRKSKEFILATTDSSTSEIGDEPKQLKQKFHKLTVAVDRDRVNGIMKLKEKVKGLKAVLLDDAFQHRYVTPGLSIILVSYHKPVFKDYILPFGNLREGRRGIHRADIVIVTKTPASFKPIEKRLWIKNLKLYPYQFLYFTRYKYHDPQPVFKGKMKKAELETLKKEKPAFLVVTGIANPIPLHNWLKKISKKITPLTFPDHHNFTKQDIHTINTKFDAIKNKSKFIITTEKDATRFRELNIKNETFRDNMYYVPVEVEFLYNDAKTFNKQIKDYVGKNKRINRLHC